MMDRGDGVAHPFRHCANSTTMVRLLLLLAAVSTTTMPMAISTSYDENGGVAIDNVPGTGSRDSGVASKPMLRRPSSQLVPFIDPEERRDESIVEVSRGVVGVCIFIHSTKNGDVRLI